MTTARWIGALVIALVIEAIVVRLGWIDDPIPKLAGSELWTTSRAAGVIAFVALTLDMVFGLFVSTGAFDRWVPRASSVDVHRWLSGVSLTLVSVHALALLGDATAQFDGLDLLVPGLSSYRPAAVGVGIIAFYAALLVQLSFGWRKRIGVRAWRALHFTAFAVFAGAVIHGLLAGSDAGRIGMRAFYAVAGGLVLGLVVLRIILARRRTGRGSAATDRSGDRGLRSRSAA